MLDDFVKFHVTRQVHKSFSSSCHLKMSLEYVDCLLSEFLGIEHGILISSCHTPVILDARLRHNSRFLINRSPLDQCLQEVDRGVSILRGNSSIFCGVMYRGVLAYLCEESICRFSHSSSMLKQNNVRYYHTYQLKDNVHG